jgi:hypothetical protein
LRQAREPGTAAWNLLKPRQPGMDVAHLSGKRIAMRSSGGS